MSSLPTYTNGTGRSPAGDLLSETKAEQAQRLARLSDREDMLGQAYDTRLARRLLHYLRPYKTLVIIALIAQVVQVVASVAGPPIVSGAIDQGMIPGNVQALAFFAGLFLFAALVEYVAARFRVRLMGEVGNDVIFDLRTQLFTHLQQMTLSFYDYFIVGRLMSRMISDVGQIQDFVTWSFVGVFRSLAVLVGIVIAMFLMDARLALLTLAVIPIMIIVTNFWRRFMRDTFRQAKRRQSLVTGNLAESIGGVRVVQSFSREARNLGRFMELNKNLRDANVHAGWLSALFFPSVDVLGSIATALVVVVGGAQVLGGTVSAGTLVAFILFVDRFFEPIRDLALRYNNLQNTMSSSERLFELLDTPPAFKDAPDATDLPRIEGHVELRHVTFSYDGITSVLKDITLNVGAGKTVAFVGETGAGKSSTIALLSRFYDIDSGEILIDGHDVRKVTMESLRRQMAVVLQQPFLFSGSIAENIRYGRLDATQAAIEDAAKAVGAHEFIVSLPLGYDSPVGENGSNLSVGQRQLVSFARALLTDPRILILDEATSSVDTQTEQVIQAALKRLLSGRTSFVIAHRLSTVVNADVICVIDQGEIVERGTHQELLAKRGHYYQLYTMQWRTREGALPD
ncbi:MAG: ABC transporter ATP-binding protein [Anaerolineae bacterium]